MRMKKGFTLIEILVVLAFIAVITTVSISEPLRMAQYCDLNRYHEAGRRPAPRSAERFHGAEPGRHVGGAL